MGEASLDAGPVLPNKGVLYPESEEGTSVAMQTD